MYIHVRVFPKSKKEEFLEIKESYFEAYIKEEAKRGLANKRVIELIKEKYPESKRIRVINGHHNPNKLISVEI